MGFCERLKELRVENRLTQKELSQRLKLTPNTICEWEKGRCEPSLETLKQLADIFSTSIDYISGRSDDFGNVTVYQRTDNIAALSVDEQKIIDAVRKSAPISPVEWVTMYSELPKYMQENIFAELKGMHLGYKVTKNQKENLK